VDQVDSREDLRVFSTLVCNCVDRVRRDHLAFLGKERYDVHGGAPGEGCQERFGRPGASIANSIVEDNVVPGSSLHRKS
jgi:hypothetical protein